MTAPTGCDTTISILPALAPAEERTGETGGESPYPFEELLEAESAEAPGLLENGSEGEAEADKSSITYPYFTLAWVAPPPELPPPNIEGVEDELAGLGKGEAESGSIEHKLPPGSLGALSGLEQIAENGADGAVKVDGMSVAKQGAMVFTDSKFEGSAVEDGSEILGHQKARQEKARQEPRPTGERLQESGSTLEKGLGVEYLESAGFEVGNFEAGPSRKSEALSGQLDGQLASLIGQAAGRLTREFSVADAVVSVERTHQAVLRVVDDIGAHIRVLRTSGQEKLEVIVRPLPGTELRLEVSRIDGLVTVQARCDRGDFALLEAGWPHVQSSLAAQGVRVEALQFGLANDSGNRQGTQQNGRDQSFAGEFHFEQNTPENKTKAQNGKSSSWQNRGWQRWA